MVREQSEAVSTHAGHRQRLRDRFQKSGLEGFADYEIVELLLTLAIPRSDVKQPAKELIRRFGDLRGVLDAPSADLRAVPGIGKVAPVALKIVKAAATLYLQQESEAGEFLADPSRLENFWRMRLGALTNEVFEVAYLDASGRIMRDGVERLSEGTAHRAPAYPRRIVEQALKRGAASIVLAHNHTNGDPSPSPQDKNLTRLVVLTAEPLDLRIVDHVIVSPDKTFSFRKAGLL